MTFYPDNAPVPTGLRSDEFVLRPLSATDVELDYEAVMASQEALRCGSGGEWPRPNFTLEENLADLQGHEADFRTLPGELTHRSPGRPDPTLLGPVNATRASRPARSRRRRRRTS